MTKGTSAPYTITMELTHRCPLRCLYCSNPTDLVPQRNELSAPQWLSIIDQAADLSIVQANLTGGEPLAYKHLVSIVKRLRQRDIYSNLITSGIGLDESALQQLTEAGLESIQLSLQSTKREPAHLIAGRDALAMKLKALAVCKASKIPLSLNVVLNKYNIGEVEEIIDLALSFGIKRLELANTQYYGFALTNVTQLLPSYKEMEDALAVYEKKKKQCQGKLQISWVIGDYLESSPKPCMGGWASQQIVIAPDGTAYPCLAASAITTLKFPSAIEQSLRWIWEESAAFNAFRGLDWMAEPCRSCEFREKDLGGCRCQAFLLTGDAREADPVCKLSSYHYTVEEKLEKSSHNTHKELVYRNYD